MKKYIPARMDKSIVERHIKILELFEQNPRPVDIARQLGLDPMTVRNTLSNHRGRLDDLKEVLLEIQNPKARKEGGRGDLKTEDRDSQPEGNTNYDSRQIELFTRPDGKLKSIYLGMLSIIRTHNSTYDSLRETIISELDLSGEIELDDLLDALTESKLLERYFLEEGMPMFRLTPEGETYENGEQELVLEQGVTVNSLTNVLRYIARLENGINSILEHRIARRVLGLTEEELGEHISMLVTSGHLKVDKGDVLVTEDGRQYADGILKIELKNEPEIDAGGQLREIVFWIAKLMDEKNIPLTDRQREIMEIRLDISSSDSKSRLAQLEEEGLIYKRENGDYSLTGPGLLFVLRSKESGSYVESGVAQEAAE